mgnify:CR=1 FL=1
MYGDHSGSTLRIFSFNMALKLAHPSIILLPQIEDQNEAHEKGSKHGGYDRLRRRRAEGAGWGKGSCQTPVLAVLVTSAWKHSS